MSTFVGIFVFFIWLAAFVALALRKGDRKRVVPMERFIQEEQEANSARRKDIDEAFFFTPDLSVLPLREDENEPQKKVVRCAQRKMIHFPVRMTNLDLKKAYGRAQLETIAQYEENYQSYLSALTAWAESLANAGQTDDALRILNYTLALGSEFTKGYKLTADLYAASGQGDKLDELLTTLENRPFEDPAVKRRIISHLMDKRSSME